MISSSSCVTLSVIFNIILFVPFKNLVSLSKLSEIVNDAIAIVGSVVLSIRLFSSLDIFLNGAGFVCVEIFSSQLTLIKEV